MWNYNYYVYIVTNATKNVLYTGVTNDLNRRLQEHFENRGEPGTFAGRYFCYYLVYYEHFSSIEDAIAREKQIKGWSRKKKNILIDSFNPGWKTLNKTIS